MEFLAIIRFFSDSLGVQIEDLWFPDVEIFSDLSTLCELMTSFNDNYVPRAK